MKVALVNASDQAGGAARAAFRLHEGLQEQGVASRMLVQYKASGDESIQKVVHRNWGILGSSLNWIRPRLDKVPQQLYPNRGPGLFSTEWVPDLLAAELREFEPDIINLHWICAGFVQIESLKNFGVPIVWTMHDMWPFTGGCHYSSGCQKYERNCGACPALESSFEWDLSRLNWRRKWRAWRDLDLTIVTPSRWLADCARDSSLFEGRRVEVIPNSLDLDVFRPIDKQQARRLLGLPEEQVLVLFGAVGATGDRRKGYELLVEAIGELSDRVDPTSMHAVVFGASADEGSEKQHLQTHFLGTLRDDLMLAMAYSAADVFVAPSREDNLPNTVLESLSCGTPVVAFDIGGMPDMIDHKETGWLAQPYDTKDLAEGILWATDQPERRKRLASRSRRSVERRYSREQQARAYTQLFGELRRTTAQ